MTARSPARTYAEYVALERESAAKHEFVRGEVVAMAGGTPELAALQAAVVRALGNGLEGRPCRVFAADLRVRVEATDFACHPDATVVCHELERSPVDDDAVVNPTLVVEVLSDSTRPTTAARRPPTTAASRAYASTSSSRRRSRSSRSTARTSAAGGSSRSRWGAASVSSWRASA